MTVRVPLSRGKFALISDEDAERVTQFKWSYHGNGYACRTVRVTLPDGRKKRKDILLHRFIVDAPQGLDVDHRNQHGLDCRRHNLRKATRSQNVANSGSRKGAVSKYKGVHFRRDRNTWRAEITINGRKRNLGTFKDEADAARAYDAAAYATWGEFAYLNFPDELQTNDEFPVKKTPTDP